MKLSKFTKGFRQLILPMGVLAVLGLAIISCSKKHESGGARVSTPPTEEETRVAIKRVMDNMPAFELVTKDGKRIRAERTEEGGWTFSTPPSETGYNYTSSTGTYTFVEKSNSGGTFSVAASGFGGNGAAGGGTIVAGSNSYNMQYTFCLSADEELFDLGLVDAEFSGVSMVIGIDGDLEAIAEGGNIDSEGEDFENLFRAFAFYIVYDDRASGSYDVVNWITDLDEDEATLNKKGFAYIFDIKNAQVFFSKSGKITASGGSIGFSGKYLNIDFSTLDEESNLEDITYKEVDGFGALGCN